MDLSLLQKRISAANEQERLVDRLGILTLEEIKDEAKKMLLRYRELLDSINIRFEGSLRDDLNISRTAFLITTALEVDSCSSKDELKTLTAGLSSYLSTLEIFADNFIREGTVNK